MMKRMILCLAAVLVLSACTFGSLASVPPAPSGLANRTVLDEQGALAVELAYKAARTAVELAVDTGLLKGPAAAQVADLDNRAFLAVTSARSAYAAGNAASYSAALGEAREAVRRLLMLTGRE